MNVNGHRSDNDEFDDESWTPPTEAEQKVIEARRERNNKISSLMGQYLLKGYKMLAITCQLCDCILLEDRQSQKYCIGCMEVDADTKKDNPAVSEHAARRTVEESQHRNTSLPLAARFEVPAVSYEIIDYAAPSSSSPACPQTSSVIESVVEDEPSRAILLNPPSTCPIDKPTQNITQETNLCLASSNLKEIEDTLKILISKLSWASNKLRTTTDLQQCSHLIKLINEIVNTIKNVEDFHNR